MCGRKVEPPWKCALVMLALGAKWPALLKAAMEERRIHKTKRLTRVRGMIFRAKPKAKARPKAVPTALMIKNVLPILKAVPRAMLKKIPTTVKSNKTPVLETVPKAMLKEIHAKAYALNEIRMKAKAKLIKDVSKAIRKAKQ
jgi:hypothetical protein